MYTKNTNISSSALLDIICSVPEINRVFDEIERLRLNNAYIAGGVITQIVWNNLHGFPLLHNIKDIDIVYFDMHTKVSDKRLEINIMEAVGGGVKIDVTNQAFIHRWFKDEYGVITPPLVSAEDGIATWLPAFSIGVQRTENVYYIYAPFGLNDLFKMIVRPNRRSMQISVYQEKTKGYKERWPNITIIPWS